MPAKKTLSEVKAEVCLKYNRKYSILDSIYINNTSKLELACLKHGLFKRSRAELIDKNRSCPECMAITKINKWSDNALSKFKASIKKIYGGRYVVLDESYSNNKELMNLNCLEHGNFTKTPFDLIIHLRGCSICDAERDRIEREKKFILKAKKLHGVKGSAIKM